MALRFPKLPTLKATWAPVYLEPIMHSGEQITVGIAATAADGQKTVVPTINAKQLSCIFGERQGASLFNLVQLTLDSLSEHLTDAPSLLSWGTPFSGFKLGPHHETVGDNILSVVQLAIRRTASFATGLTIPEAVSDIDAIAAHAVEDDKWPKRIYDAVVQEKPDFKNYFSRYVPVRQGFPPSNFDFYGRHYVANFGRLFPPSRSLTRLRNSAKARLWDLAHLREAPGVKENVTSLELILWRPNANDMAYSDRDMKLLDETLYELSEEARGLALNTFPVHSPGEASHHIILREAA